jgi:hypothetical protein
MGALSMRPSTERSPRHIRPALDIVMTRTMLVAATGASPEAIQGLVV